MDNDNNNVIMIGCGGREHAIVETLIDDNPDIDIYVIGSWENPGIEYQCHSYGMYDTWKEGLQDLFEQTKNVKFDYAVIGPELPLTEGVADYLYIMRQIPCIGPTRFYSQLESHKWVARYLLHNIPFMRKYNPKTHKYVTPMLSLDDALKHFNDDNEYIVIKPDGLTGGMQFIYLFN